MVLPWSHIPVWLLLLFLLPTLCLCSSTSARQDPSKVGNCCRSPAPIPARGFLILRTKSTSPHDPFNPPAGPLSLHRPSLLLGQYFSRTFHPAPWECTVPALCTAPVASLGPGHSADHSPLLSLCPVYMEHSLCFGPVHSRMCAA